MVIWGLLVAMITITGNIRVVGGSVYTSSGIQSDHHQTSSMNDVDRCFRQKSALGRNLPHTKQVWQKFATALGRNLPCTKQVKLGFHKACGKFTKCPDPDLLFCLYIQPLVFLQTNNGQFQRVLQCTYVQQHLSCTNMYNHLSQPYDLCMYMYK